MIGNCGYRNRKTGEVCGNLIVGTPGVQVKELDGTPKMIICEKCVYRSRSLNFTSSKTKWVVYPQKEEDV